MQKNDSNKRGEYQKFDEFSSAGGLLLLSLWIVDSGRHSSSTVSTLTLSLLYVPTSKSLSSSASSLMLSLSYQGKDEANNTQQSHHKSEAAKPLSCDDLMKRYKDTSYLMAGHVFGNGNGCLGAEVCNEVIHRN